MSKVIDRTGERHLSNDGEWFEIVEYINNVKVKIRFSNGYEYYTTYQSIKNGKVKNPFFKKIHGVGYMGVGKYKSSINKVHTKEYIRFKGMMDRCYDKDYHLEHPTYEICEVHPDWHDFQVFAEWINKKYNPKTMQGWHLDKDILKKGNKIYSAETCCLVPHDINVQFAKNDSRRGDCAIGVTKTQWGYAASIRKHGKPFGLGTFKTELEAFTAYKIAKEVYIKELAEKFRDVLEIEVYEALINYSVDMTD